MSNALQDSLSKSMMAIKADLGGLIELLETWILSLGREEERLHILRELHRTVKNHGPKMPEAARTKLEEGLSKLLDQPVGEEFLSVTYRHRLQKMVDEAAKRLSNRLEQYFLKVNQVVGSLDVSGGEANAGIIIAQEEERKRISREIHDGPAQSLASLTMRIDFCLENIRDEGLLEKELQDLKNSIIRSLKDIRRFIFDLRPMALDDLGLVPTIEQFITGFKQRTGLPVYLVVDGERVALSGDRALGIFRVIQEAVNNAARHAEAKSIHVFLAFNAKRAELSGVVKDDGQGFDVAATKKNYAQLKKLGLMSMEERIRLAGGSFELISAVGSGTIVSFKIPIPLSAAG